MNDCALADNDKLGSNSKSKSKSKSDSKSNKLGSNTY